MGKAGSLLGVFAVLAFLAAASLGCVSSSEPSPGLDFSHTAAAVITPSDGAAMLPPAALISLPSLSDLVDRVEPAVVSITVEAISRGLFFDFTDEGAGSGIVVRPDGYIVTNYHVVRGAEEIKVTMPHGKVYDARVVGWDALTDLATIKVEAQGLPTVTFGQSDELRVGDWVLALGNALALKGGPTVTLGIISAKGRTIESDRGALYDLIQTDAAVNEGTSGGPLVNMDGEVVGISTAISREGQGIAFAISSSVASPIIDTLIEKGRVVRPLIGLVGTDVTPARASRLKLDVDEGIIVTRLPADGPAYQAGIRTGDVIVRLDGVPTPDMARFLTLLWSYNVGDVVLVDYISGGQDQATTVELAERPPEG